MTDDRSPTPPPPAALAAPLRPGVTPRLADDGIWTVLPADAPEAEYDSFGASYDRLVKLWPYARLVWAADTADWTAFAQLAVDATGAGSLLDVACGSLTFTDRVYAGATGPTVLLDRSIAMLRMGRGRLAALPLTDRVALVVGDGLALPFADASFDTVVSHGSLHVFEDLAGALAELVRCLRPGGGLYLTSLVDNGRWIARKYMEQMQRMDHFATIRTADEFAAAAAVALGVAVAELGVELKGNLVYVRGTRPGG